MTFKFTPEMFRHIDDSHDPANYAAAETANAQLDKWLSEAPVVSGIRIDGTWAMSEDVCGQPNEGSTHTARLVMIEQLEVKQCEHEPDMRWNEDTGYWRCHHCNKKLNPKWEAEG